MLSERKIDFGSPKSPSEATQSIKISNIYKETVTISELFPSTSDISVRLEKTTLSSKETALLEVSLNESAMGKANQAVVSMKMTFDGINYKTVNLDVLAFAESGTSPAAPVRQVHPGGSWADQMFAELKFDFGPVARGATAKHIIEVTNLYKEDVTLTSPESSCGCITPTLDRYVLKSREKAQLILNLDTVRFSKKRDVTVTLSATFDQLNYKTIRIPITAYIRSDVVFEPGSVEFGVVSPGEPAERRVRVVYAGRNNWTVRAVRGSNSHVTSEFKELSRGNGRVEYELLVRLAGSAPVGTILDQVVLETDDAANPTIPILVDGAVEADLQITPEVVQFGQLKPGVPKVVNIVVKGRKPFRIENVECDSARECFSFKRPAQDKTVHVIGLTITPPNEPGELKEAFTVTIAGRSAPLVFQAIGTIEASKVQPAEPESPPVTEPPPESESAPATDESAPPVPDPATPP